MLRRQTYTATISSDARRTGAESTAITPTSVVEIRLCRAFSRYSRLAIRTSSCLLYPRERTCAAQLKMSALGQKQTYAMHQPMSALPRKRTSPPDMPSELDAGLAYDCAPLGVLAAVDCEHF